MTVNAAIVVSLLCAIAPKATATVDEYDHTQRDQWFTDIGGISNVSIVDFAGFADFTPVNEQWASLGVHFSGAVFTSGFDNIGYPNNGWGAEGYPQIEMLFDAPMSWIAADFRGNIAISIYDDNQLLFTTGMFGIGGPGNFGGLLSDQLFNRAIIFDPVDELVVVDDIFFGPPIAVPAPGAIACLPLLLSTAIAVRRRRPT